MPELPPAYCRDAAQIGEIANRLADAGAANENIVPGARDLAIRLRAFLSHWRNQSVEPSHEVVLAHFRDLLLETERHIEALHIATLVELLEYHRGRIHAHNLLTIIHHLDDVMQAAAPDDLVEMQRKFEASNGTKFEAASAIADQTAEIARQDADCERLVDEYERDWPDRLDDAHYLAILNLELEQHEALAEELELIQASLD